MPTVERTFTVDAEPSVVLRYLSDFANAEVWDPGTQRCVRQGPGPVAVGATWSNTSKFAGVSTTLVYTLEAMEPDRLVFVGSNDTATSTDTITVTPHGNGSRVSYRAQLEMHGLAKLAGPAVKLVFEKVASATRDQMIEVLDQLADAS